MIPPGESESVGESRDPLRSYISLLVRSMNSNRSGRDSVKILAGIDWTDMDIVNYLCSELSDVSALAFDDLPDVNYFIFYKK